MGRTRKHYDSDKSDMKMCMHDSTYHGLNKWSDAMFEKLGWMVLSKAKGYKYKISPYKQSIVHLIKSIEHAKTEIKESDRLRDLDILIMNVTVLNNFVKKHL
jgi:hypothetical protein